MSVKLDKGDKVKTTKAIVEGRDTPQWVDGSSEFKSHVVADKDADPYEAGWVHARSGSVGGVIEVEPTHKQAEVLFKVSGTVARIHFSNLEVVDAE